MSELLDRPESAAQMSKLGRERLATYDLDSIIQMHEQLYAEALGS
jgi:hypothetical protein